LLNDLEASLLVDLCRQGLGEDFDPIEVAFVHPEPDDITPYQEQFRCQLRFSAPVATISFYKADLARPLTAANEDLVKANDHVLDEMLTALAGQDIVSEVKSAIIKRLPSGSPSQASIAQLLLTSSRTLSRRLAEKETTYRDLVTEVRKELADRYVKENVKPLTEVSYLLGFSDLSSFSRAFKRWFGEAPNALRSRLEA
jgi:AraC-like DNA-binding protein